MLTRKRWMKKITPIPSGTTGLSVTIPMASCFDLDKVDLGKIAGKNPRRSDCKEQEEGKIILRERYIAHLRNDQPSDQKIGTAAIKIASEM